MSETDVLMPLISIPRFFRGICALRVGAAQFSNNFSQNIFPHFPTGACGSGQNRTGFHKMIWSEYADKPYFPL
jgi:hypothetical protein